MEAILYFGGCLLILALSIACYRLDCQKAQLSKELEKERAEHDKKICFIRYYRLNLLWDAFAYMPDSVDRNAEE